MKRLFACLVAVLMFTVFSTAHRDASAAEKLSNIKVTMANPLMS